MKGAASVESALPREKIIRSVVDDPANLPEGWKPPSASSIERKNVELTGNVFMTNAHQVRDVPQAIEYLKMLANIKPWFTEEPTAPGEYGLPSYLPRAFAPYITQMIRVNRILGHAHIRRELRPHGIGVATGEHTHELYGV